MRYQQLLKWALFTLLCGFAPLLSAQPMPQATYSFNDTLTEDAGVGPDLLAIDPLGLNGFETATVFGETRTVYRFDGNSSPTNEQAGLSLNTTGLLPAAYSVEMVFLFFDREGAWRRILDASNRSSDSGFYVSPGNKLDVFPVGNGPTDWSNNNFHHVVITNNGAGQVTAYLDGIYQFDLNTNVMDFAAFAVANPNNLMLFFADNTQAGGQREFSDGQVSLVRLYDTALTADDVATLGVDPELPPQVTKAPAIIPTLSEWGLIILLALLSLIGFRNLAVRHRAD